MQSSPVPPVGKNLALSVSGNDAFALKPGTEVKAEVVGIGPDNSVSIKVNDSVLTAQSEVQLQMGDLLSLRVERQESVIYLRLAGNTVETADNVKNAILPALENLQDLQPAAEWMLRLSGLLSRIPEDLRMNMPEVDMIDRFLIPLNKLTASALKEAVQDGGVFFETKLRILAMGMEADADAANIEAKHVITGDLKAALLRFKETLLQPGFDEFPSSNALDRKGLLEAVNGILRNIEYYQLQSKLTDSLQLFLPLVWKELRDGELILRQSDRGSPGERTFSCCINLDLERAGKVQVRLLLQAGSVHVSCAAENRTFSGLLQESSSLLEKQLESAGLRLGGLTIQHEARIDFAAHGPAGLSIRA
ncbi:MAG TPA: flagellar hook-length control protein FliK [Nitrospirota bacterium]|nr:flagellar hook-length control protein FliK [Nitrospirota bacterium]